MKKLLKYNKNFTLYFVAGGFCAIINWFIFYILNVKYDMSYILAGSLAFIASTGINFILSKFIFKSKGFKKRVEFMLILFISAFALCIDLSVMTIVLNSILQNTMIAKIIGTGTAFFFNFSFRQFIIFDKCEI